MDVSIIIPTYNRLWSLPEAVKSCFDTALKIEVIVVDDGSTDGTASWLEQQAGVTVLTQENSGKDWAVNAGFAIAKGKYVRFLDSDDWILPGSTDRLFEKAEKEDLDITCAGYWWAGDKNNLIKEIPWIKCDDFIAQQLGECDSSHYSAYLFKKVFIENIPHRQDFGALDDRQFVIESAIKGPKTGFIETPAFVHRIHANIRLQSPSVLQDAANHLARYNIYKRAFASLAARGELTQRRKEAACDILWHLSHWIAKTDIRTGKQVYEWVYELNPQFKPKENAPVQRLYRALGFTGAEKLMAIRRLIKK